MSTGCNWCNIWSTRKIGGYGKLQLKWTSTESTTTKGSQPTNRSSGVEPILWSCCDHNHISAMNPFCTGLVAPKTCLPGMIEISSPNDPEEIGSLWEFEEFHAEVEKVWTSVNGHIYIYDQWEYLVWLIALQKRPKKMESVAPHIHIYTVIQIST
jgi:hypothetical protein